MMVSLTADNFFPFHPLEPSLFVAQNIADVWHDLITKWTITAEWWKLVRSPRSAGWREQNQTMNLFSVEGGNGWEEGTWKSWRIKSTPIVESLWCVSCKSMKRKKSLSTTRQCAKKKQPAFEAEKSCCDCGDGGGRLERAWLWKRSKFLDKQDSAPYFGSSAVRTKKKLILSL